MMELKTRNKLSNSHKKFLLTCLAIGESPAEAAREFNRTFGSEGVDITESTVRWYARTKYYRDQLAEMRAEYIAGLMSVPIASESYRIEKLQRAMEMAEREDDPRAMVMAIRKAREALKGVKIEHPYRKVPKAPNKGWIVAKDWREGHQKVIVPPDGRGARRPCAITRISIQRRLMSTRKVYRLKRIALHVFMRSILQGQASC